MNSRTAKRCIGLGVLLLVVLGALGWAKYLTLHVQLALGEEQISYFAAAVDQAAREGNVEQTPAYIVAVQGYYPSGTKQRTGSRVDRVVEQARRLAIQRLEGMCGSRRAEVDGAAEMSDPRHK